MIKSGLNITGELKALLEENNLKKIKSRISFIIKEFEDIRKKNSTIEFSSNGSKIKIHSLYLSEEINQIYEAQTIERTKYYIKRLIKSLSEIKTGKHNDLNLNRWKEYNDILTDSIWLLDKRDKSGAHNGSYWGNFVPQIPNQFLRRYTKKGDWILDTFLGSGTTLIECKRLGRNGIGIELLPKVTKLAEKNIKKEENPLKVKTEIINSDSTKLDYKKVLKNFGISSVQFIMMHPPYWDIIKFSENKKDLSNAKNINEFLKKFGEIIDRTYPLLEKDRYLAVVIGDKYSAGEWIPLGFYTMQEVLKRGYKLKSTIVKNFEETKGKMNQKELWRYRALVGGFYIFKHEYIFLFQKT
ncbi:MAG: DNA methyltransferase [Ignavibacteriaceae bacterium]